MLQLLLRWLLGIAVVVSVAYIAACLFLFFQQTRFIFSISCDSNHTGLFNLSYQEVWLPVPAGDRKVERIHGWWMPAATNAKVLLYLHGNGINIRTNVAHANRFSSARFSVLLIDYRGYGRSEAFD